MFGFQKGLNQVNVKIVENYLHQLACMKCFDSLFGTTRNLYGFLDKKSPLRFICNFLSFVVLNEIFFFTYNLHIDYHVAASRFTIDYYGIILGIFYFYIIYKML